MKFTQKLRLMIIIMILLTLTPLSNIYSAEKIQVNSDTGTSETVDFIYFYVNLCESCTEAKEQINLFIEEIQEADLDLQINFTAYNISYYDGFEYDLFLSYLDHNGLEITGAPTPMLFVGDTYYSGEDGITEDLPLLLEQLEKGYLPETPLFDPSLNTADSLTDLFEGFNALKIFGVGLINGLNPCSLSMLLLLISLVMVKDTSTAKMGFTFLLGKFISFLFLGTILYQTLDLLNSTNYLFYSKLIIGLFVMLLAGLNLYDYFASRKENYGRIKNQLPKGLRMINHRIVKKLTSPDQKQWLFISLFILGIIIAVSEFLCTGQVYMITINYMISHTSGLSLLALAYLTIYSFAFIIPPAIVIIIIDRSNELFNISEYIREKMPLIKLLTALILIILGLVTILL